MSRMPVHLKADDMELGPATADLGRNRGLKQWSVSGTFEGVGPMPQDTTVLLTLPDDRVLTGHAFLKNQRMTSNATGTYTVYTYLGTGPLDGAMEYEFN